MAKQGTVASQVYELVAVPLDQIEIDTDNVRTRYDQTHIDNLREALRTALAQGEEYINAPVVYRVGRERFRVKHGNCRVLAARGVHERLHVRIVEPPGTQSDKVLDQLGENLLQGGLGPLDTSRALRQLQVAGSLSVGQLVTTLKERGIDRSTAWVRMYLGLSTLHPDVQEGLERGQVSPTAAWALHGLPGPQQRDLVRRIINEGLGIQAIKRAIGLRTGQSPDTEDEDDGRSFSQWAGTGRAAPEFGLAQLREDIARAASLSEQTAAVPRRVPDTDHRAGLVAKRWELLPVRVEPPDSRRHEVDQLASDEWSRRMTASEAELAKEAAVLGGHPAVDAASLAQRVTGEFESAPAFVAAALNALRLLIENPASVPEESATATFLAIRMQRVLQNFGRGSGVLRAP
jgi:hypothetical protein